MFELDSKQIELIKIIEETPDILTSKTRFEGVLADIFYNEKALINAMTIAYAEGIVEEINNSKDISKSLYFFSKKLERTYGIAAKYIYESMVLFVCICGREDELSENSPQIISNKQYHIKSANGTIEYSVKDSGAVINNIQLNVGEVHRTKMVIVIPETIDGYDVIGILPNALNNVRLEKCKMVLVPNTLKFLGDENVDFYSEFNNKSSFPKPKIYFAINKYENYEFIDEFYERLTKSYNESLIVFEISNNSFENNGFILMNKFQNEIGLWKYPEDGKWIASSCLYKYTGTEKRVRINECIRILPYAFVNDDVEEITFGTRVIEFSTRMIYNCKNLINVIFETGSFCKMEQQIIQYCPKLNSVVWPFSMNCKHLSLYSYCPSLGNMVLNKCLMTCQCDEVLYRVENGIQRINGDVFVSCNNLKIIIVPESVSEIDDNSFDYAPVSVIIFEGMYTNWKVHPLKNEHLYIYSFEDSNVQQSLSPFVSQPLVHMKNINALKGMDNDSIIDYCYKHMDRKSDDEMVLKPYRWEREIYEKN